MKLVAIRFKKAGRTYLYLDTGLDLKPGDRVVVETGRGTMLGWVVTSSTPENGKEQIPPVIRRATAEDLQARERLNQGEKEALAKAGEIASRLHLPMKLLTTEYNLEGTRLTVYFSAESRLDFHEISKELAASLKTRVELRQLGPRDAAKMIAGCGPCGRPLCCSLHLCEFDPVSIKMAKEQEIPLTPMKISGLCGRLLCCLSYEFHHYHATSEKMPRRGQEVITPQGKAKIVDRNLLKEKVMVQTEDDTLIELGLDKITFPANSHENSNNADNAKNSNNLKNKKAGQEAMLPSD